MLGLETERTMQSMKAAFKGKETTFSLVIAAMMVLLSAQKKSCHKAARQLRGKPLYVMIFVH